MAIEFSCGQCCKVLRAPEDSAGRKCRCRHCGHVATVPDDGPPPLPSASPSKTGVPQSKPALRGGPATSEPNWMVRIVGGMVGAAVILIIVVVVYGHVSNKKKGMERDRLTRVVDEQISTAKAKADAFNFDAAVGALDKAAKELADSFLSGEYLHDELVNKVEVARSDVSKKRMAEERDRLTRLVDEQISTAMAQAEAYDFDAAVGALDDAANEVGDSFLPNELLHDELIDKIQVGRNDIRPLQVDYHKKIRDGWIVFEGRLIRGFEHERILAERKKQAEQHERRRREEDERRRELARQAELRRQEEERLAAAEKAKTDAFFMSQEFVKKKLKVPSSAKFPVFRSSDVTVIYDDDTRKYTVLAWVEAQNPFGVYLRSSYMCTLWPAEGNLWRSDFTSLD